VAQFFIQLSATLVVAVCAVIDAGGWSTMWSRLPPGRLSLFNADAGIGMGFWFVYLLVIIFSYNGATWGLAQRFVSVKDPRDARRVAVFSAFLYLLYPLAIFIPAWAAPLLMPESFDPVTLMPLQGFDLEHTYIMVSQKILAGLAPGFWACSSARCWPPPCP